MFVWYVTGVILGYIAGEFWINCYGDGSDLGMPTAKIVLAALLQLGFPWFFCVIVIISAALMRQCACGRDFVQRSLPRMIACSNKPLRNLVIAFTVQQYELEDIYKLELRRFDPAAVCGDGTVVNAGCPFCDRPFLAREPVIVLPNCGHVSHRVCVVFGVRQGMGCLICGATVFGALEAGVGHPVAANVGAIGDGGPSYAGVGAGYAGGGGGFMEGDDLEEGASAAAGHGGRQGRMEAGDVRLDLLGGQRGGAQRPYAGSAD